MSNNKTFVTVVAVVLAVNAVCRTVQIVPLLLHLGPNAQALAFQGAIPSTAPALAQDDWQIVSNILVLLSWWCVAALAWLVRSEALRRPTVVA